MQSKSLYVMMLNVNLKSTVMLITKIVLYNYSFSVIIFRTTSQFTWINTITMHYKMPDKSL